MYIYLVDVNKFIPTSESFREKRYGRTVLCVWGVAGPLHISGKTPTTQALTVLPKEQVHRLTGQAERRA